jgi:hypothetical protein
MVLTERFTDSHGRAALRYLTDDPAAGVAAGSELLLPPTVVVAGGISSLAGLASIRAAL